MSRYTHLELNRDVQAPAGYYTPRKEGRIDFNGREVLYVVNHTVIDSSCCGVADFGSVLVPGYIVAWKAEKDREGHPVSAVEPIPDQSTRNDIRAIIREAEHISHIEFW